MPIVNEQYVTPNWTDGQAPAIDAEELTAMGDSIAQNQTSIADNTTNIGTNTAALAAHARAIQGNATNIASLKAAMKLFTNVSVPVALWGSSETYAGFGYKAVLTCGGVTSSYAAQVTFAPTEAMNGNYAPVTTTGANSVTIYARAIPAAAITIPTIIAQKQVE